MKNIGIFAGTFDPIHKGHVGFALAALEAGLDYVYFLVEPRPRRKQGVHALEHRQAMVRRAIKSDARLKSVEIEQPRFSVQETLPVLQNRFRGQKLVLLVGDDVAHHLAEWPHLDTLTEQVSFMIAANIDNQLGLKDHIKGIEKARNLKFEYSFVIPPLRQFSSSKVRRQVKNGLEVQGVEDAVLSYIQKNGLYTSAGSGS